MGFCGQQPASLPGETLTDLTQLLVVQAVEEDAGGVTLRFMDGGHGRLALHDPNHAALLRLARGSQERRHPVGIRFGEGQAVTRLIRADNDVPRQVWQEGADRVGVLFEGHDGVFCLKLAHPEFAAIRAVLDEAIERHARVWFIAEKPDLALLDVRPAGWSCAASPAREGLPAEFKISFVVAPDELLRTADEILRAKIRCTAVTRRDIRAVARAYIDEADELKRTVHDCELSVVRVQIRTLSPREIIEKATRLRSVRLSNAGLQAKVRKIAESYVLIARENQRLFDEFMANHRELPGGGAP